MSNDGIPNGLLHDTNQDSQRVFDRRAATVIFDPTMDRSIDCPGRYETDGEMTESGYHSFTPACQVRIKGFGFQSSQGNIHDARTIVSKGHRSRFGINTPTSGLFHRLNPLLSLFVCLR